MDVICVIETDNSSEIDFQAQEERCTVRGKTANLAPWPLLRRCHIGFACNSSQLISKWEPSLSLAGCEMSTGEEALRMLMWRRFLGDRTKPRHTPCSPTRAGRRGIVITVCVSCSARPIPGAGAEQGGQLAALLQRCLLAV